MPEEGSGISIVLSTFADEDQARSLARRLVDERLIACGNVVPGVTSIYRWQGKLEEAGEVLLVMKTTAPLVPRVRERIVELHPYEVPEVVAIRSSDVAEAYGRWVRHETTEVNG
jgi:periplasmic divalent cation tolerance protein